MKKKIIIPAVILILASLAFQTSPYARRIRPFASTPSSCSENEIGYNMTSHSILICTNSGYTALTTGGSGSFAPIGAKYVVQTADATLTNEQALSALATGILKNTTTTGILSIAGASDVNTILPTQIGHSGEFLTTNGTISSWNNISAGITNSAPNDAVAISNGTNIVGSSDLTWNIAATTLGLEDTENGNATIKGIGVGVQLFIQAANGDATHVGGELTLQSGASAGQDGGQLNIIAGLDSNGGDGGQISIESGTSTGVGLGGSGGNIDIRANPTTFADGDGGTINIVAGGGVDGDGGDVLLQSGTSTNGSLGSIQLFSGASSIELANLGFFLSSATIILDGNITLNKTITATGTTGAQTIDKTTGSVNFAVGATSLIITNSLVSEDSIIQCTVSTNDATLKSVQCVPASGSFTMFGNAVAATETRVNFTVTN